MVNENLIAVRSKQENESRWKTKAGFDVHGKKSDWNEHPKKPHQATMDDLMISFVQQKADTKRKLQDHKFNPADHGKVDFYSKVKNQ